MTDIRELHKMEAQQKREDVRRCETCRLDMVHSWTCGALVGRPDNRPGGLEEMREFFSCSEWEVVQHD